MSCPGSTNVANPSIPPVFAGILPTNPSLSDIQSATRKLANIASRLNPIPGIIYNEAAIVAAVAGTSSNAPNANNTYYSVYFPTVSHLDQFTSYSLDQDAAIVITRIAPLPSSITYLDINFYLRGEWPNSDGVPPAVATFIPSPLGATSSEWNGSINQTVTTYQYTGTIAGATGPTIDRVVYACNKAIVAELTTPTTIVRTCPIEYCQSLTGATGTFLVQSILFRAVIPDESTPLLLNQYFRIEYYQPNKVGSVPLCCLGGPGGPGGAYYTLADSPSQNYIDPIRVDYPIDVTARAAYQTYVAQFQSNPNLTQLVVENYFASQATVVPGAIDSAFRARANNFNVYFDNRTVSYNDVYFTTLQPYDKLYVVQYNQKLEQGRCDYLSVSFYDGNDSSLISASLTIPAGSNPTNVSFLTVFVNDSPGPRSVGVAQRIYQYYPPNYDNSAPMYVFLLPFNPSAI